LKILTINKIKIGDKIELIETDDTWTNLKKGSKGTIYKIEKDQDLIWVNWETGEKLALIFGVDKFKVIPKKS
jgi:hypothetical protein